MLLRRNGRGQLGGGFMSITPNPAPEGHLPPEAHGDASVVPRWVVILFAVAFLLVAYRAVLSERMDRRTSTLIIGR